MNTKFLNVILVGAIVAVVGVMGFFAWRLFPGGTEQQKTIISEKKFPEPTPITNKGKESEDRDAMLERDVRALSDAAIAYAADHAGKYPESDFKNPCSGVQYCLKGVNINSREKIYLPVIPQVQPYRLDYHYRADNAKKTYCIVTPSVTETHTGKVFQCTEKACEYVSPKDACQ